MARAAEGFGTRMGAAAWRGGLKPARRGLALTLLLLLADALTVLLLQGGWSGTARWPAAAAGPMIYLTPGIAMAGLAWLGPRHVGWVALASLLSSLGSGGWSDGLNGAAGGGLSGGGASLLAVLPEALLIAGGDGLAAVIGAVLLRQAGRESAGTRSALICVLAMTLAGPVLGCLGFAAAMAAAPQPLTAPAERLPSLLAADAAGNLIVVPLAVLVGWRRYRQRVADHRVTTLGVVAGLALLCTWAVTPGFPAISAPEPGGATGGPADAPEAWSRHLSIVLGLALPLMMTLPLLMGAPGSAVSTAAGGLALLLVAAAAVGDGVAPAVMVGWVGSFVAAGSALILLGGVVEDRLLGTARLRRSRGSVAERRDRLRRLAFTLLGDRQAHRAQLATQLHDRPLQDLAMAQMNLNAAVPACPEASGAAEAVAEATASMRGVLRELAPPVLVTLGLFPAIRALARRHQDRGLEVRLQIPAQDPPRLTPAVEAFGFRVIEELLANVAEHADAREAEVAAGVGGSRSELWIRVTDDGVGLPQAGLPEPPPVGVAGAGRSTPPGGAAAALLEIDSPGGLSLFAIREVVDSLGGVMRIRNLDRGVEIRLKIPAPYGDAAEPGAAAGESEADGERP